MGRAYRQTRKERANQGGAKGMAYFLVKHGGSVYANTELYYTAVAGGERNFLRMLHKGEAVGKEIFDQVLYRVDEEQQRLCAEYAPKTQDLDEDLERIEKARDVEDCRIITVPKAFAPKLVKLKGFSFMRIRDLNKPDKYRMLPKLAAARVGVGSYIALDAVRSDTEKPIIVTIGA
jgi:hypothetical protein